jgi:hypothetical protein
VDRFVREELPEFELNDVQMHLELYRNANGEAAFDHFEKHRESNVKYLRSLPRSAGERRATKAEAVILSAGCPAPCAFCKGRVSAKAAGQRLLRLRWRK